MKRDNLLAVLLILLLPILGLGCADIVVPDVKPLVKLPATQPVSEFLPPPEIPAGVTILAAPTIAEQPVTAYSLAYWAAEVTPALHNPVVYASHGCSIFGVWGCQDETAVTVTVSSVVLRLQEQYPGRPIVLLICNPGHHRLNIPNVYYATENVWIVPDNYVEDFALATGVDLSRFHNRTNEKVAGTFQQFTHD